MTGSVNNRNSPQFMAPRPGTERDADPSQIEKKPGKLAQLKTSLTAIKNKLTNTRTKSLSVISDRMSKEQTMQAMEHIRAQRRASLPARENKLAARTEPAKPDTATQRNNTIALRNAVTAGLIMAMKSERGAALIDTKDVEQFTSSLNVCLRLEKGTIDALQFSTMAGMQSEIAPFLPAEVAEKFSQLLESTRQELLSQFS